ncbi:hypothetical protein VOLCADRAFT_102669 [Volvox carteri f. nagariensis]|uniref:Nucleotide-diphospho-sugar transferase domain-containing protein n=1 Tax=Volvox carteri f. nagariensis TaxID=3068 RepID=D8THD7_VOLCA|nr:uncharacterized protein VOLCADRAFT_102669 [Volvox carteri f. nagariensis]EFJ52693.1 hypothetical protein VOLCADRAFT_102669 [Volvox carteri f. nagariensis]|eukprot:XP_002945698.1 hypothetical protein VOLCADRAFT_102669 [Volvox carteri f. nagariensis]
MIFRNCLTLFVALTQLLLATANRVCESSGFCSNGKVRGYIGPLDTAEQLQDALEATHFRKEVIVFGETRLPDAAQALARFRDAGYSHVIPVLEEVVQCHHLKGLFYPWPPDEGPISCGTYATSDASGQEYITKFKYLARLVGYSAWWRKWFTVGRAVALGYNVMAVDTDVLVLDDWYWRVKQPPLSDFNMLTQNEWGISFNGGFSYIQNAASSGPIAWLLFEALHRAVRWAEDDSAIQAVSSVYKSHRHMGLNDQGILQECLHSAVAGHPIFPSVMAFYANDEAAYRRLGITNPEMFRAMHDPVMEAWEMGKKYSVAGELGELVCERFMNASCPTFERSLVQISTAMLRMPHSGVKLWPDPEDPNTEEAARATKSEMFGYLASRRVPYYPLVGIGHIWANLFPGEYQKEIILMHTGWYNWRIAARLAKSRQRVYIANQPCSLSHMHVPVPEVRTVIAYQPGVIHAGLSKEQYVAAVQGLAQVAVALGAIAAWPAAPCDSEWALTEVARKEGRRVTEHTVPWSYLDTSYTVQPFGNSLEELKCEWAGFSHYDCLCSSSPERMDTGRGMLAVEFHHLLATSNAPHNTETTLKLGDGVPAAPLSAGNTVPHAVRHADLVSLNAESLLLRPQREHMPIFWLDRLVEVPDLGGEAARVFTSWRQRCLALRYLDLPEDQRGRV